MKIEAMEIEINKLNKIVAIQGKQIQIMNNHIIELGEHINTLQINALSEGVVDG